jgi:hypothetical protein
MRYDSGVNAPGSPTKTGVEARHTHVETVYPPDGHGQGALGELDSAKDVERGDVTSERQLKDTFARSYHALSNYKYRRASESWAKKKTRKTGQALTGAAHYMEHAAKWSGRELETGTADTIGYARVVDGKPVKGASRTEDEVDKGMKGIGSALSKF